MFLAGTETISSGLPRLIAVLIDSGRWAELQARPECVLSAIDEGFRWTIPSPTVTHGVARDCCVDGVDFRAGRRVNVALRNVLRDARFVEGPNAFRIDRVQPALLKNLWFGGGPHYCLGASLAVAFHRTVLERLLVLPGSPRVVDRRATRGSNFPAYRRLVVEFART
jgi:cytochrome P450